MTKDQDKDLSNKDKDCILVLKESLRTRTNITAPGWLVLSQTMHHLHVSGNSCHMKVKMKAYSIKKGKGRRFV